MSHVYHLPVSRAVVSKTSDEDYIQFCFELYCDALRLSADTDRLSQDWERVAERMWLEASHAPPPRRCGRTGKSRLGA